MNNKTFIIAEAGVNHCGDVTIARRLIDEASRVGADAVKFQTFRSDLVAAVSAKKAEYQLAATDPEESQRDMLEKLQLSPDVFRELASYCRQRGITFMSTAFDIPSVELVASLGADPLKIPSGEITHVPLLRKVASYGRPTILSTGMATLGEVETAVGLLLASGLKREDITVLHCTTEYPAPMEQVNLEAMVTMGRAFGVKVGYSDHTQGITAAIVAVALGASVIEKHLTVDKTLPGPDQKASLEPEEFRQMVRGIRDAERMKGDGLKIPAASEVKNIAIARRSIVALEHIKTDDVFTANNVIAKRPGTGIPASMWDSVIGQKARRDFKPDEMIEL